MEIFKLTYPGEDEGYLKALFTKTINDDIEVQTGSVILKKGDVLPAKTYPWHMIAYIIKGKYICTDTEGKEYIVQGGDFIFIEDKEIRKSECLEETHLIFFLSRKPIK